MAENEGSNTNTQGESASPAVDLSGSESAAKDLAKAQGSTQESGTFGAEGDPDISTFQATQMNVLPSSDE